ncbi:TPA: protease modulator HflC [Photobacterium damselae]|uniref:Protein HflC n=3 Tax=Photobacterium damselae TaxID=38293 RepID=D0Z0G7_PHODD|nr:protease modulator HflC [Photobacterium damselae]ARR48260.1 protease modulator HflC [Photobacterium damselae subsp. damselae]AWK82924.1 HflC protein [Photobacterium damselae]EEZ41998.1 HflC protein [Photobacterium damselae subsp. damselae CIP 102761]EHA1082572.1 protease modulator HflC [Photobacterium damselae]EJN6961675.1 protease modulator HflC [Photobacterium damselae]
MRKLMIPVVVIFIALLLMSVFVVKEGERGIVVRFGRIIKDNNTEVAQVYAPGLHFKVPVFDRVHMLDARIQTMDDQADRFLTAEKKDVIIDTYVKWRIQNFGQYYLATGGGNISTAEALLKRKVVDSLRAEIGAKEIKQIVSGKDSAQPKAAKTDDANDQQTQIAEEIVKGLLPENDVKEVEGQRDQIMADVLSETRDSAKDLGIEVVDFRIKKINLPDEISESIYRRMRAERESVARSYRSQGRQRAEELRARAELKVATILAEANRKAQVLRGDADAQAADTYAEAYTKNPEFFSFWRSLKAYEKSFNSKNDVLVIDPDTEFFRYMNQANPKAN